jgi:hypothetical protein
LTIAIGVKPRTVPDLTYHAAILARVAQLQAHRGSPFIQEKRAHGVSLQRPARPRRHRPAIRLVRAARLGARLPQPAPIPEVVSTDQPGGIGNRVP